MDYAALKSAEVSNRMQIAVMRKSMDAAVEQNQQLLEAMPEVSSEPGLGAVLDRRV
jgi:hypothetical protein